MAELRIYYGVYEQANHFIKPIFDEFSSRLLIRLIKLSKSKEGLFKSKLAAIYRFVDADILITLVQDGIEVPLFILEFSEAVTTEDHELQRFPSLLAAVFAGCFYCKISPIKESRKEHGGNVDFDIFTPYALLYEVKGIIAFHFEWPLLTPQLVERDRVYLSCPPRITGLEVILNTVVELAIAADLQQLTSNSLSKLFEEDISKIPFVKNWIEKLKSYSNKLDVANLKSSRTRYVPQDKMFGPHLLFKINRMEHAMDPERGMLWYYGSLQKAVLIARIIIKDVGLNASPKRFLERFCERSGLDKDKRFINFLKSTNQENKDKIDVSGFVRIWLPRLQKPLAAIFCNAKALLIQDGKERNKVILKWDLSAEEKMRLFLPVGNNKSVVLKKRLYLDEDDITYILAHQVLQPNGFDILHISYPGAQGDRSILPEPTKGRKQKRQYLDIIAFLPEQHLDLTENKGEFSSSGIKEDVKKLKRFLTSKSYEKALRIRVKELSEVAANLPLLLSIGFWNSTTASVSKLKVAIESIDFFVFVQADMKIWVLWHRGDLKVFSKTSGEVQLTDTYEVVEDSGQVNLFGSKLET